VLLLVILGVSVVLQVWHKPWRAVLANLIDMAITLGLVFFAGFQKCT